ncbi:hypothetical protein R1sor_015378 [Riccia sorocarpa]|uniref:Zinc knuckle CX2CX4HX4C domain-containing protein n=1 Tax=Riccia sorocarpa TaxID=122646 RepID=A0ABD3HF30_9MARC
MLLSAFPKLHRHLRKYRFIRLQDSFAAVNTYGPAFDDANPAKLKQIITVLIHKADRFVTTVVDEILKPVGKVLHSFIDTQGQNSVLKAITLSARSNFVTELEVPITPQVCFTLRLDYERLQLRCRLCQEVSHSALDCPFRQQSPRSAPNKEAGHRAEVRPPAEDNRNIDLNTRPVSSATNRRREDRRLEKRPQLSNSSSSTGSSIRLYEQFRPPLRHSHGLPSVSNSTSAAATRSSKSHRTEDSQAPIRNSSSSDRRQHTFVPATAQGLLPLPGLPLSQGIALHNNDNSNTFNRVYAAYVPPPIAARLGDSSLSARNPLPQRETPSTVLPNRRKRKTSGASHFGN